MPFLSASLIALSLLSATGETPSNPAQPGAIVPETRVERKATAAAKEPLGRIVIGLRIHGPRFRLQGECTREKPLLIDLPLGDFFKLRVVYPAFPRTPLTEGGLY